MGKCHPPKFSDGDKRASVLSCFLLLAPQLWTPQKSTQEPAAKMVTKGEDPPSLIRKQNMVIVTRDNKARNMFLCQNYWRVKQLPLPKVFIQFKEVISNIVEEFLSRVRSSLSNLTRLSYHLPSTSSPPNLARTRVWSLLPWICELIPCPQLLLGP